MKTHRFLFVAILSLFCMIHIAVAQTEDTLFNAWLHAFQARKFDESVKKFYAYSPTKPCNAEDYYHRPNTYAEQATLNKAFYDFSKAIELKPDYVDAYYMRGHIKARAGKHPQAVKDY